MRLRRPSYSGRCPREPLSCESRASCVHACMDHPHAGITQRLRSVPTVISDGVHPCRSVQSATPMVLLVRSELTSLDST